MSAVLWDKANCAYREKLEKSLMSYRVLKCAGSVLCTDAIKIDAILL